MSTSPRSLTIEGQVYIAECQGVYKIGHTTQDPRDRVAKLRTGNPFPVELVGSIPGSRAMERYLHRTYKSRKIKGEWFILTPDEVKEILGRADEPEAVTRFMEVVARLSPAQTAHMSRELKKLGVM